MGSSTTRSEVIMLEKLTSDIQTHILQKKWAIPTGVGLIAFGVGAGVGYFVGSKRYQKVAEDVLEAFEEVVDEFEEIVDEVLVDDEYLKQDVSADEDEWVLVGEATLDGEIIFDPDYKGRLIDPEEALPRRDPKTIEVVDQPNDTVTNVFADSSPEWDYEEEVKARTRNAPYVLHKDEFWAEESGYTQLTMTYYAGDDIMVDSDEVPVYNYLGIVGELKFGHGSDDPGVFFVRNDQLEAEYEILLDRGYYEEEVLGNFHEDSDIEIKHSRKRKLQDE